MHATLAFSPSGRASFPLFLPLSLSLSLSLSLCLSFSPYRGCIEKEIRHDLFGTLGDVCLRDTSDSLTGPQHRNLPLSILFLVHRYFPLSERFQRFKDTRRIYTRRGVRVVRALRQQLLTICNCLGGNAFESLYGQAREWTTRVER